MEHKSGNIAETRKDRRKVTMENLYSLGPKAQKSNFDVTPLL